MAEETTVGGPNEGGDGQQTTVANDAATTTAAAKAARKALLEQYEVEAIRGGNTSAPTGGETTEGDDGDDLDLSGVEPAVAAAIKKKLSAAKKKDQYVGTLATFGIEQARTAEALKIAREFKLEDDEIPAVEKALATARTPDAVSLAGRELRIKLREDGSVAVQKPAAKPNTTTNATGDEGNPPPVDNGRGGGSNRAASLQAKIDAIAIDDPEAEKKLEALKPEIDAAQRRFMERTARGR